jgi:hypothetical protein
MIRIPLTAYDVYVAATVGMSLVLEALSKSGELPQADAVSWDRAINGAVIDYAMGTVIDRYWPNPRPNSFDSDRDPNSCVSDGCDPAAQRMGLSHSGARICPHRLEDPPVLWVEMDLKQSLTGYPIHISAARRQLASPTSEPSVCSESGPDADQQRERDAQLVREWINKVLDQDMSWPGFD